MLREKEHIDNLFADHLSEYEEQPPNYIWNNIQMDLKKTRSLKRYSLVRAIAASLALFLTFGLGYYFSDFSQRKRLEARHLNPQSETKLQAERTAISDDSSRFTSENSKTYPSAGNETRQVIELIENTTADKKVNKGILYKIFDLSKDISISNSKNELNTNRLTQNEKSSKGSTANQLLIDTLLLEKENLLEGGFLLSNKEEKPSKWSFGTKFSPVYSMTENTDQGVTNDASHALKSEINNDKPDTKAVENSLTAFSGGINVNYHLNKRWSLESGLLYSQRKQTAENLIGSAMTGYEDQMTVYTPEGIKFIQPEFNNQEMNGPEVIGTSRDETFYSLGMNYVSNFEYIEFPIVVRYKIIDRKVGLDVLSGVSTNFLIGNKTAIVQNENDLWSGHTEDISPMLYNATLGLGLNYNFYHNFSFNLEPTFKYSIISSESVLTRYPYSFAVFAGFSYRFK